MAVAISGSLIIGEDDRPTRGIETTGEHPSRFARLTGEDRVAIERDHYHVRIDRACALRLQRGERGGDALVVGRLG